MHAAVPASGEVPQHPGVGGSEGQFAGLGTLSSAVDVVEDPGNLARREVGGERESGLRFQPVGVAVGDAIDDGLGAGVLPDDCVVHGLAGGAIPDNRRLALVGDAHGGDVVTSEIGLAQRLADHLTGVVPDRFRVMFDPSCMRKNLAVLQLTDSHHRPVVVEDDRPAARGALIDRNHVLGFT